MLRLVPVLSPHICVGTPYGWTVCICFSDMMGAVPGLLCWFNQLKVTCFITNIVLHIVKGYLTWLVCCVASSWPAEIPPNIVSVTCDNYVGTIALLQGVLNFKVKPDIHLSIQTNVALCLCVLKYWFFLREAACIGARCPPAVNRLALAFQLFFAEGGERLVTFYLIHVNGFWTIVIW